MSERVVYCTYFDSGYLSRGLALIHSLREHGDDSSVWVLTLDEAAHDYLVEAALPGVVPITVAELEAAVPELPPLKAERSHMEYYFTMTPLLVRHVMDAHPEPTLVAYLDADLFFFRDPGEVVAALGEGSVGIIEHRYRARLARRLAKYGRFNVGWVGFRSDEDGRRCLQWWGESTLAWCGDHPSEGRYADQGYLDRFPEFAGVRILPSSGFNLAPWNTAGRRVETDGSGLTIDGDSLVFFHFHGVKRTPLWWMTSQLVYGAPLSPALRDGVYVPYLRRLERFDALVAASAHAPRPATASRGVGLRGLLFRAQRAVLAIVNVLTGNAIRASRP